MGSILASTILSQAATTLLDTSNTRWPNAEKLIYLNDGQRLAVLYKPDANVVIDTYILVEGTVQRLPDGSSAYQNVSSITLPEGITLLDIIRNMGTNGTTVGTSIDVVDLQELNAFASGWHAVTGAAAVQSFAYDEKYPEIFFVYPPQPSASFGYITIVYSAVPNNLPSLSFEFVDGDVTVGSDQISETGHGLKDGQSCILTNSGGTLPAGLAVETTYYAIRVDADTFKLASTYANAFAGTDVDITAAAGGGTHTLNSAINLSDRYQTALYYYVLHRAYAKDASLSPFNAARAIEYWNLFVTELGRLDLIKRGVSPNVPAPNPSPSLRER